MKKYLLALIIIVVMFSSFKLLSATKINQATDYVPNKETAIKVAEAIWLPIYGDRIYNSKPFVAKLVNDKIWIVQGTLTETKGGVPYIEIQRKDCKILKVLHGK